MSEFLADVISYVELGEHEIVLLRALHPRLAPHFPAIAERFYDAVFANPTTAAVLNGGPDQLERLRVSLIEWMSSGLLGPYDDRFYEKRSRIGRRHVQIGLEQQYMFTAMNVVRTAYIEKIVEMYPHEACPVVRAVNKLLDIELAVMLHHYQLDSEETLLQRERRIQSDRLTAMQTLSAGLAHEVRNPLNAARLQLELLERRIRRQFGEDSKLTEPTALANHELERLTNLLNDFLSFARPPELHIHEHDVIEIGRHVIDLERPLAQQRGVALTFHEVPPIMAQVDSGKIHQIIQNLIRNGLEASTYGGHVGLWITGGDSNTVHIRVTDDGVGIPGDVLPRIFEPFYSTKETGTGMGMAIVHSLVAMHGGKIEIDTGPHGTRFDVTVPQRGN
ncbi:MAG TPA: protoglobin domain-containing protein [Kofleriaceae bacterium]